MNRYQSLARLAKPPLYTHVHFLTHPGSPSDLFSNNLGSPVLDPSHPGTQTNFKAFPNAANTYFRLRAFPNALLIPSTESSGAPSWSKIDLWADRVSRAAARRNELNSEQSAVKFDQSPPNTLSQEIVSAPVLMPHPENSIPMNLYFSLAKTRTHKHATKRRRLRTKFRGAINLIVTRGAKTIVTGPGAKMLDFDEDEVRLRGNKWILPDWAYLCYPNSELYLVPHPELIQTMRRSLQQIWDVGMRLERVWAKSTSTPGTMPIGRPNGAQLNWNTGRRLENLPANGQIHTQNDSNTQFSNPYTKGQHSLWARNGEVTK